MYITYDIRNNIVYTYTLPVHVDIINVTHSLITGHCCY